MALQLMLQGGGEFRGAGKARFVPDVSRGGGAKRGKKRMLPSSPTNEKRREAMPSRWLSAEGGKEWFEKGGARLFLVIRGRGGGKKKDKRGRFSLRKERKDTFSGGKRGD